MLSGGAEEFGDNVSRLPINIEQRHNGLKKTNLHITKLWLCCDIRREEGGKAEQQYTYGDRVTHNRLALLQGDALLLVLMNKQTDSATRKWRRRRASVKKVDCTCDLVVYGRGRQ